MSKVKLPDPYGDVNIDMLADLTLTNGISGHERDVADVFKEWVEDSVDVVEFDNLGSIIAIKKGLKDGPKVMLSANIDEAGFVVKHVDKDGYIKIQPVGKWWLPVLPAQPVVIKTRTGLMYVGVISSKVHRRSEEGNFKKFIEIDDLYVDLGVSSKEEVELLGIEIGDSIARKSDFHVLANPNFLMSKAWRNRAGTGVVIDVMRNLKDVQTDSTIFGVGTVQGEVGLRGARTAANFVKPDVAITLDVTASTDTPGEDNRIKIGVGTTFEIMDATYIGHKGLLYMLEDLSKDLNIDYQIEVSGVGANDSGEIHKAHDGVIALTISIPARYIGSHNSIINRKDYADTVKLLTEFCKRFDTKMLNELIEYKRHNHEYEDYYE